MKCNKTKVSQPQHTHLPLVSEIFTFSFALFHFVNQTKYVGIKSERNRYIYSHLFKKKKKVESAGSVANSHGE